MAGGVWLPDLLNVACRRTALSILPALPVLPALASAGLRSPCKPASGGWGLSSASGWLWLWQLPLWDSTRPCDAPPPLGLEGAPAVPPVPPVRGPKLLVPLRLSRPYVCCGVELAPVAVPAHTQGQ